MPRKQSTQARPAVPQVSSGNVHKCIRAALEAEPHETITNQWLGKQMEVSPGVARQVSPMLRFFGILQGKYLAAEFVAVREDTEKLLTELRDRVIDAYADACGLSRATLQCLGSSGLHKDELWQCVKDTAPFTGSGKGSLEGGSRENAKNCLWAWHRVLADRPWLERQIAEIQQARPMPEGSRADPEPRMSPVFEPGAATESKVYQGRIPRSASHPVPGAAGVSELLQDLADFAPVAGGATNRGDLTVTVEYGETVIARVKLPAPLRRQGLSQLGRLLQVMEEMA